VHANVIVYGGFSTNCLISCINTQLIDGNKFRDEALLWVKNGNLAVAAQNHYFESRASTSLEINSWRGIVCTFFDTSIARVCFLPKGCAAPLEGPQSWKGPPSEGQVLLWKSIFGEVSYVPFLIPALPEYVSRQKAVQHR
jgi:hypothetical protein